MFEIAALSGIMKTSKRERTQSCSTFSRKRRKSRRRLRLPQPIAVKACVNGKVVPIEEVPDQVFSTKVLGDGVGIWPDDEMIVAPADCTVSVVMEDTKHAIGLHLADGADLLIHVGMDTVNMGGEGFEYYVGNGDTVTTGQKLISFSKEAIKARNYPDCVIMVVTDNPEDLPMKTESGMDAAAGETTVIIFG